jgi:hypothetical protein
MRLVTAILAALLAAAPASAQEKPAANGKLDALLVAKDYVGLAADPRRFTVQSDATRPDGHVRSLRAVRQCAASQPLGLSRSGGPRMEQVKTSDRGEMAILKYTTRDLGGLLPEHGKKLEDLKKALGQFEQRHLNAHRAKGGVCIDIHLSKVLLPGDEAPPFAPSTCPAGLGRNLRHNHGTAA